MTVYKHTFQITVMNEVMDYDPSLSSPDDDDGLETILSDITEGDSIGMVRKLLSEVVPVENVRAELVAMGNDGDFFDII